MSSRNRKGVKKIQSTGTDAEEENVGHGSGSGSDTNNSDSIPVFVMKVPERVMGRNNTSGELQYAMKWKGIEELELVPAEEINLMCPQLVIKFYEENFVWPIPGA